MDWGSELNEKEKNALSVRNHSSLLPDCGLSCDQLPHTPVTLWTVLQLLSGMNLSSSLSCWVRYFVATYLPLHNPPADGRLPIVARSELECG